MLFEFEEYHPETPRLESAISRREGVVYSVVAHIVGLALIIFAPQLPFVRQMIERAQLAAAERQRQLELARAENPTFVFVRPKIDMPANRPPPRAELSDQDRVARTVQRAPNPTNPLPFARGNSTERVESQEALRSRGQGPAPEPSTSTAPPTSTGSGADGAQPADADPSRMTYVRPDIGQGGQRPPGGSLGDALRNIQRYVQRESFSNPEGGAGAFGPSIQFDTKGVEFGPWIRRFIAQIKRNWFPPMAAMSFNGHTVLTFNVHKDGRITDLAVIQPSSVPSFNTSALNALMASNPTQPLPPEYPSEAAFFTVTFYYNETPPSQ